MPAMAATCNLPQPNFPTIHSFPSPLPSRRFILPFLSRQKFPKLSMAAAVASLAGPLEPLTNAGPVDSVAALVNPALVYANLLFFNSGYNVQILVEENEPEETLIRRFRREVSKAGIIQECKRRRFFENKHDERKRKKREACRRNRRRRFLRPRFKSSSSQEENSVTKKSIDDLDDNWEYHDVELP